MIFDEGSAGKEIYFIINGQVEVSQRVNDEKKVIAILEKGDFFGEMASLNDDLRSMTVKVLEDVYLEELSLDSDEIQAFLGQARQRLSLSDGETIRVIEDVVDVLIRKKLLLLTDLPQAAQKKLMERQRMRSELGALGNLVIDEEDIL